MSRTSIEKLGPKKARELLDCRAANRKVSAHHVKKLAAAMKGGEWVVNGESIKLNIDKQMEDGQHRCYAVIAADVEIETYVTRGIPLGVFHTIDAGKRRSLGDVLARDGVASYRAIASALRWLWTYENNRLASLSGSPSHSTGLELFSRNPGLADSVRAVNDCRAFLQVGLAAFMHYEFSKRDSDAADEFFARLADGVGLTKSMPVYAVRERLLADKASKSRLQPLDVASIIIRAWNAYRAGGRIRTLKARVGDSPTPEIK